MKKIEESEKKSKKPRGTHLESSIEEIKSLSKNLHDQQNLTEKVKLLEQKLEIIPQLKEHIKMQKEKIDEYNGKQF